MKNKQQQSKYNIKLEVINLVAGVFCIVFFGGLISEQLYNKYPFIISIAITVLLSLRLSNIVYQARKSPE